MSEQPHILDGEVDLDHEDVRDSRGRRIDADYIERAVADEGPSAQVSFRIPEQIRRQLDEQARTEGRSASEIVRRALQDYLSSHQSR
jgi:Ribbon-helix-helix protein, copG family